MKIKINGKYIKFFDKVAVSLKLDSVASAFSFVGRFNPDNPLHREVFRPLSFGKVQIYNDNEELLLTGTIINHTFNSDAAPMLWNLSGYSLPGVLEDVNIPVNQYPLESLKRNLRDITEKIIAPFGIGLRVDGSVSGDVNLIYEKSVADPSESIKSYLSKLASQRNIVLSHDPAGNLVYYRPNIHELPKMRLNKKNTISMSLNVKGQGLHSEISVLRQPSEDNSNISPVDTVQNGMIPAFRPAVKVLSSGTDTATKEAANNELAAELKNLVIGAKLDKITDLKPGDIVEVQNDELFISEYVRLVVSAITFTKDTKADGTSLQLVLPESFTGTPPKNIFR